MTTPSAATSWREPPSPVRALTAAGVLTGAPEITDLSRSHSVHLLALPGGQAYAVKRLRRQTWERGRSLAAELFVYRLASWTEALAGVLPQALMIDERHQVLVLRAAGSSPAVPTRELARSLGTLIAGWHAATTDLPIPALTSAGILRLPGTDPASWGMRAPAAAELGRHVVADPVLPGLLEAGAAAWRPRCLVHGDLKWDNCLVDGGGGGDGEGAGGDGRDGGDSRAGGEGGGGGGGGGGRVRVIDWELSGLGDPAWDVSSVIAEHLAVHPSGDPCETAGSPVPSALMRSYTASSPLAGEDFGRRCALFTIARLLHLALEHAEHTGDVALAAPAVETARRLGADVERLTAHLNEARG